MLNIEYQGQYKRDLKVVKNRGYKIAELEYVISLLANGQILPSNYHDHDLNDSKRYKGVRECHIRPNWLLIYYRDNITLRLIRTGTHSDLFDFCLL